MKFLTLFYPKYESIKQIKLQIGDGSIPGFDEALRLFLLTLSHINSTAKACYNQGEETKFTVQLSNDTNRT